MRRLGNTRETRRRQLRATDMEFGGRSSNAFTRGSEFDSWAQQPWSPAVPTEVRAKETAPPAQPPPQQRQQLQQQQWQPSLQPPTHVARAHTFKNVRRAQSLNSSNSRSPQGIRGLGSFPGSRWSPRNRYCDLQRRAVSEDCAGVFSKACAAGAAGYSADDSFAPLSLTSAESWLLDRGFSGQNGSGLRRRSGSGLVAAMRVPSTDDEETAIMVAAREGNLGMCRFLCGQKETLNDVRVKMVDGSTPYMAACRAGHKDVVVFLSDHGATDDIFVRDNYGATPFLNACLQGHFDICKWLYQRAPQHVRVPNDAGTTPMLVACDHGHLSIAKFLYAHGAAEDVSVANKSGWNCMSGACMNGHLEVVKWLLDNGATAGATTSDASKGTPMLWACQKGHAAVVSYLVENGGAGDLHIANKHGWTPMYVACRKGRLNVCRTLARHGAFEDALVPDAKGVDACTLACRADKLQHVCKWLLMCGAPVRAMDFRGRPSTRLKLIEWAQGMLEAHHTFVSMVLCAMMGLGAERGSEAATGTEPETEAGSGRGNGNPIPLSKLGGMEEARLLVADFAGVSHGPHLRHLRYLPVAFAAISWSEVDGDDSARETGEDSAEEEGHSEGDGSF
eukprot:CAMPEP_0119469332 /NCGR_PEP_ID=MMETSP1344-20130328/2700_1 /TAXON_ID=236787 /ORGANISM="Florenciella parvula, Strain CCMP2471" /LENGTH=618 /DNA_ID=CAMNT_0007501883 /DNA_START=268 /DNA_END=2124 /DNA_ORIENTATION=-